MKIFKKTVIGLLVGLVIFPLMATDADELGSPAFAADITRDSTIDTLVFVLVNPEIAKLENINRARTILRERIIFNPDILDGISAQIIVKHPSIFNQNLLNKLFDYLKSDNRNRSASSAIVTTAVNTQSQRLTEEIIARIASAFDDERSAWWAADIASRLARTKPYILNHTIINRLFLLIEDENSWIVASAAISDIGINTKDEMVQNVILTKAFAALGRQRSARQAAYIIFKISEKKPHLITDDYVDKLFTIIKKNESTYYDRIDFAALTYLRDRSPALYASDALAAVASFTKDDALSKDILSKASSGLDDKDTARLASYIVVKISGAKLHLITHEHLAKLFSLIKENDSASYASDGLAAIVSLAKDESTAVYIYSRAIDALDGKGSDWWAARILAAGGERWNYLINRSVVDKLLSMLRDEDTAQYASTVLTQTALYTKDGKLSRSIVTEMLHHLNKKDPEMGKARKILEIARVKPKVLQQHIEQLFTLLQIDSIKNEISLSLYFVLLSGDKEIQYALAEFIEDKLSKENMEERRHESFLRFAQKIS